MKIILLALAAAALIPVAASANEPISRAVRLGDLDLGSRAGIAERDRRVARAAAQICQYHGAKTAWELREATACRDEAVSAALSRNQVAG